MTLKKAYLYIIPFLFILAALGLYSSVFFQIQNDAPIDLYHVFDISFYHFIPWLLWFIYLPLIFNLFHKYPLNKQYWKQNIKFHLLFSLGFSLVARLLAITLDFWIKSQTGMIEVAVLPLVYEVRWTILASFPNEIFSYWLSVSILIYFQYKIPKQEADKLILKSATETNIIPLQSIAWIKASANYVIVHTSKGEIKARKTLSELLNHLNQDFVQIHRSIIVNQNAVSKLYHWRNGEYLITMKDGSNLSSSRSFLKNVKSISI